MEGIIFEGFYPVKVAGRKKNPPPIIFLVVLYLPAIGSPFVVGQRIDEFIWPAHYLFDMKWISIYLFLGHKDIEFPILGRPWKL